MGVILTKPVQPPSGSGGGGSLIVQGGCSGSFTTVNNTSTIGATDGFIVNENSSGFAALTASIGIAEDGTYSDGLFTDFTECTRLGIAIDRFNEVLKALAPNPAPDLDNINILNTGVNAYLSFGTGSDQSGAVPSYTTVSSSAGYSQSANVNDLYTVITGSGNIRAGIFAGATHMSGILNSDVVYNSQGNGVQNYPKHSFGEGDTGILQLNVNGATLQQVDLTLNSVGSGTSGLGTGSHVNGNGSGFNFFAASTSGTLSNGNAFESFQHRTGQYVIALQDQRNGWNYAKVLHVRSGSTSTTNYVEWVNDDDSNSMSATGNELSFEGSGSIHLSGVEYFQSGSAEYKVRTFNAYRYVHDLEDITFSTSDSALSSDSVSFSIANQSKPNILTGSGEDHLKTLHLTGSSVVSANYFISGTLTAGVNVSHPLKSNLSNAGQTSVTGILMYDMPNTSTNQTETFRREDYRIQSGSYDTQASLVAASNIWDSEVHMTSSNGDHSNGLQYYNTLLYGPTRTLLSGDFRDDSDGGLLNNAPLENPNYSGESGLRTFYRWFKNETGSTQYDLTIGINGTGTIVSADTALTTNNFRVFVKFSNNGSRETGWLDLGKEFVLDSYEDFDGAHTTNGGLTFDSSLNATNYVTLGTVGILDNEYVALKIEADAAWTGYLSQITVNFGAGTGSIVAVPDLDDIDCNDDGTDCNLSFGATKSVVGYTNVGTTAGFSAADINDLYETQESSNNLRRSVFALDTIVEGDLNEDISASSPSYVANSFSDANSGSIKLEVNGVVVHEVEITGSYNLVGAGAPGSGTDTTFNTNGSGFFDLSTWKPAEFSNGLPYYLEIYRTGKYRVTTSDQRNGWNYARVIHSVLGTDRETNYVEWVNDNDANALSAAGLNFTSFEDDTIFYQSGVKYFVQPSGSYEAQISNIYKNVYSDSSSAISFTSLNNATATQIIQSGSGLTSTKTTVSSTDGLQLLNSNVNSESEVLHITGSVQFSRSKSLSGSYTTAYDCQAAMVFQHPLKSNLSTSILTADTLHVFSGSDTSNENTHEYFTGENHRIQSASYDLQADVTDASNNWDPTITMNDAGTYPGHSTGLLIYDGYLISPFDGGNRGDFRNHDEGGSIEGPAGNVNYSSLSVSQREHYRGYLNNTTNDRPSVGISIYGDAELVGITGANQDTLGANKNVFVEVKIPGKTGFMDLGKPSAGSGNYSDGDGCLSGDLDEIIDGAGASNTCTFNGRTADGTVSGAEYIVIKISAHENWTGYISQVAVTWG